MKATFQLLLGYLRHRPLSAALAIGLLALGTGVLSLIVLLDRQLTRQFERNQAGVDLVIGAKGSPLQLVTSTIYHADSPTGNVDVGSVKAFGRPGHPLISRAVPLALGDSYRGARIVGTVVDTFVALYGGKLAEGLSAKHPMHVVAGSAVAARLGLTVGSTFASVHGLDDNPDLTHADAAPFEVVGILKPRGLVIDELLLTPVQSVWQVHGHHADHSHDHHVGHSHDDHASEQATPPWYEETDEQITALLAQFSGRNTATLNFARNLNANTDLMAATPAVVMAQFSAQVAGAEQVLRALGGAIVVASLLSLLLVLLNALRERRGDLSLLRSLGATPGFLLRLLLTESLVLAVAGVVLGLALGRVGFLVLGDRLGERYYVGEQVLSLHPTEVYVGFASVALAVVAALWPALQAYRIAPGLTDE